jgi:hypothetical protein
MAQNRLYFSGLMEPEGPLRELASARMPSRATEVECGCHFESFTGVRNRRRHRGKQLCGLDVQLPLPSAADLGFVFSEDWISSQMLTAEVFFSHCFQYLRRPLGASCISASMLRAGRAENLRAAI